MLQCNRNTNVRWSINLGKAINIVYENIVNGNIVHWGLGIRTVYNVRIRYPDKVRWLGIRTKQRSRYPDKQMKCPDTEDYSGSRYPDSSPYNEKLSPDTEVYSDPKVGIQKLLK